MARKTNNSRETLASVAEQALIVDESPRKRNPQAHRSTSAPNKRPRTQKSAKKSRTTQTSSSEDDDEDADVEGDASDGEESDEDANDSTEPAALAPSVRVTTKVSGEQTGRSLSNTPNEASVTVAKQSVEEDASGKSPEHERGRKKSSQPNSKHEDSDDDDDDDDYAGVDLISDSDEDEDPNIERLEEKNIIETEEANEILSLNHANEVGWESFDIPENLLHADTSFFDDRYDYTEYSVLAGDTELLSSTSIFEGFSPPPSDPSSRRVRFVTPSIPLSDASDVMSNDGDVTTLFTSTEPPRQTQPAMSTSAVVDDEDDAHSSCGSASGYETDYGDTTEEEDVPANAITKPQALFRRPPLSSFGTEMPYGGTSAHGSFKIPIKPASRCRGPQLGTFTSPSSRPVSNFDAAADNMIIFEPRNKNSYRASLSRVPSGSSTSAPVTPVVSHMMLSATHDFSDGDFNDMASQISADPVLSAGPDFTSAGFPEVAAMKPPAVSPSVPPSSVFFPLDGIEDPANFLAGLTQDDVDEDEELLNVEDFIHLGDDSSDNEGGDTATASATLTSEIDPKSSILSPKQSQSSASSSQDLLRHFDTGVITAFRRGQPQTHGSQRHPAHGLSLSASAIKRGRHATSTSFPVNSSRKRNISDTLGHKVGFDMASNKRRLVTHR